jgi:hypothetical protein
MISAKQTMLPSIHLKLTEHEKGKLSLELPLFIRISLLLIAGILFFGLILPSLGDGQLFSRSNAIPSILFLVVLLGALYRDRWIWDSEANTMERHVGLLFLYGRKTAAISELASVQIVEIVQGPTPYRALRKDEGGSSRRSMYMLTVFEKNATRHRLEMFKGGKYEELEKIGNRIAELCNIPLVTEETS